MQKVYFDENAWFTSSIRKWGEVLIHQVLCLGESKSVEKKMESYKNHQNFKESAHRIFWSCKFNLAWSKACTVTIFTNLPTSVRTPGYIINFFVGKRSTRTICRTNVIPISKQVCIFFTKKWLVWNGRFNMGKKLDNIAPWFWPLFSYVILWS